MPQILTEQHRVQYSLATSMHKSAAVDAMVAPALRMLLQSAGVVAAVGELGRRDGWDYARPVVFVGGPPTHCTIVMDELLAVMPTVRFALDSKNLMMQVLLLDARPLWGRLPLPAKPSGRDFARLWARHRIRERHHPLVSWPDHPQAGHGGVDDWITCRTILQLAGLPVPQLLDLPTALQLLYVSRNIGHTTAPASMQQMRLALGEWAADALDALASDHRPLDDVARWLHFRLLDRSAGARLLAAL